MLFCFKIKKDHFEEKLPLWPQVPFKKSSNVLPRNYLITNCKSFVRIHLDYGNSIYDPTNNETFCQQIGSIQCNVSLAVTGAIEDLNYTMK